jgi:hypothetical protein
MRMWFVVVGMLVALGAGRSLAAERPTPGAEHLASLERFAGEWVVDGKWSDGQALHARSVYAWSLGKRIMTTRTFVQNGSREYQRYEGVFAWHPEKKCLFHISFAYDGSLTETIVESKDADTLHIGWLPFAKEKPSKVRQVIRFLDRDQFQWIVSLQDGDHWKQIMDATWKRKPEPR